MTGHEDAGLAPEETLTIVGGRPLTRVDADDVRHAATLLDDAAAGLRAAARRCSAAHDVLRRSTWAPDPLGAPFEAGPGPREVAAAHHAADLAQAVAAGLAARATTSDRLALRLRIAAGLYRRGESVVERSAGALTAALLAVVGRAVDVHVLPWMRMSTGVGAATLWSAGDGAEDAPAWAGRPPPGTAVRGGHDGILAGAWRQVASLADEAMTGLAWGVDPRRGVTGGAGELATLVRAAMPGATARVTPLAGGGPGTGPPDWAGRPSATVGEALARTADLYPHGSGIAGRPGTGAPAGTLAVERVTHDDGTTSWTVLVPGTQSLVSATHPFDGLSDLELMAHEASELTDAVTQALDEAGAGAGEPVVLVGHSLGGIAAVALASSPAFAEKHRVGGVVTAGAPTATFDTPRGVPVLHLENDEGLVAATDGRSSAENPATADRVTVGRALRASNEPLDRAASGSIALAHAMPTHLRTLAAARTSGSVQVAGVTARIERLLGGTRSRTTFFAARRSGPEPIVTAPGRTGGTTTPPPGVPAGAVPH